MLNAPFFFEGGFFPLDFGRAFFRCSFSSARALSEDFAVRPDDRTVGPAVDARDDRVDGRSCKIGAP